VDRVEKLILTKIALKNYVKPKLTRYLTGIDPMPQEMFDKYIAKRLKNRGKK
jgi:hypothetical protein